MNIISAQVQALDVTITKEWQNTTTLDLRNHLVHKLIHIMVPASESTTTHDRNMNDLIAGAKKIEADLYAMANSRFEYYNLVAEKLFSIQQELDEKQQNRHKEFVALNQCATTSATAIELYELEQTINQRWNQLKINSDANHLNINQEENDDEMMVDND